MILPPHLTQEIERGRVVLILGAGASRDSRNSSGKPLALAQDLACIFARDAGIEYNGEPLDDVVQATFDVLGTDRINSILSREFENTRPSKSLSDLFRFPWRRCYTLNIDDTIENIGGRRGLQRLEFFNGLSDRRREMLDFTTCHVVHLNGAVKQKIQGYLLSRTEYAKAQRLSLSWYEAAGENYFSYVPVFLGTSLNEPLLAAEIEHAKEVARGRTSTAYVIVPANPSPIQKSVLESQNIVHICGTLEDFVNALGRQFSKGLTVSDVQSNSAADHGFPLHRLNALDAEKLKSFWPCTFKDLQARYSFLSAAQIQQLGRKFYSGFGPDWGVIFHRIYCELQEYEKIYSEFCEFVMETQERVFVVTGQAGSGKSTCVRRLVAEYSRQNPEISVYDFEQRGRSVLDAFKSLSKIGEGTRTIVHVDDLHAYADEIGQVIAEPWSESLIVATSARSSDWEGRVKRQLKYRGTTSKLERFSEKDAPQLVRTLQKFVASPALARQDPATLTKKLAKSKRQLLIAMKEATGEKEFDLIIEDEFRGIA